MSASPEEAAELSLVVSSLLLNLGTITIDQTLAFKAAGQAANRNKKPVIFDPVGVGATRFRFSAAQGKFGIPLRLILIGTAEQ